ncbi:DUF1508 domain-containing protein [Amycolatopsis suaedae]|uniref:DUF1508 domain-containing protein n=1 Tax=Amycolatopsis suaedae TaxID=2510978 RepID=A0A4Q7IXK7_9PSEU|nr:DUF1508 domain-containing protein [Amycolatopsis suaedae]RZQ59680.1 DUF1508 domain-containing protein [Amycolatopsis suaedae]
MARTPRFQLVDSANGTRWRLLGGNNLSLGGSAGTFRDATECAGAILRLRATVAGLTAEFSHTSGGSWRWLLYADAELVAVAGRGYGRKVEARQGLDRFRAAVPVAGLPGEERIADWRTKYRMDTRPGSR